MDKSQEEMQFVGFFGIYKEAFKTIFSWKKIFTQITLSLILPLTLIFLVHTEISNHIFWKMDRVPFVGLDFDILTRGDFHSYSNVTQSEWTYYWLFKAGYFTTLLIFSLLSTAAVVYTMACLYTGCDVTFVKSMKAIRRVWKRLILTFLCTYLAFFVYNAIAGVVILIWYTAIQDTPILGLVSIITILIIYALGFLYMTTIWQLASVVTVLESTYGFKAMKKGMYLIKGKKWVAMGIFFILYCIFVGLCILFLVCVDYGEELSLLGRVMLGILCVLLLVKLFLFGLVTQTVLYLVCKSHHREMIDKLSLSARLGGYLGESEPALNVNQDIQLGRPQV